MTHFDELEITGDSFEDRDEPSSLLSALGRAALERTRTLGGWAAYGAAVERMYSTLSCGAPPADLAEARV